MIEPERFEGLLTFDDEERMDKLQKAYQGCYKELRHSAAVKYIQNNVRGCETMYKASKLLDDMQKLYGRFLDKNQRLKQSILVEKMHEDVELMRAMAKTLYDAEDYINAASILERANNIREKAAKIEGLDKIGYDFDPEKFQLPEVVITTDPRALKGEDYDEAELDDEPGAAHGAGMDD